SRLEAETGLATGFEPVGFVELATDPDRVEEYRRVAAFNRYLGAEVHEISGSEVGELFPLARIDDVLAGFLVPGDGKANPVDITMSLAKGARQLGVNIVEGVPATGVLRDGGAVSGVRTALGDIETEYVVNCAGMWARQLGDEAGINIPLQAAAHYYLITDKISGVSQSWPIIEDPASHGYYRPEGDGLMIGLFEPVCAPWQVEGVPQDASFTELAPDWDRMAPYIDKAMRRVPATAEAGIKQLFCGPESFTPDLQPIVGEAPELKNYFVAAGLNSVGILTAGGVGRVLAHWIVNGRPDVDVTEFNIDRLHPYQSSPEYRRARTVESLGLVFQPHYPTREMETARGAKLSPLHQQLSAAGAYFRETSGWEAPDWFAPPGVEPTVERLSWGRQNWFPYWQAEHEAARQGVVLMDMSFMSKFVVEGRDAGRLLDSISAGQVNGDAGVITYTQWLNEGGTLEADLTVTKLDYDRFWVVASDTAHRHAETWMHRHTTHDMDASVTDVTSDFAQINIQGPRSRHLMQTVTSHDLSNDAFPFRAAQEIEIGSSRILCIRITYVGELGYELYVPAAEAGHIYDQLIEAGREFDLRHAGLKALSSLRMEKGYRDYGHDIDNTDTVWEAGLGFTVDLTKHFVGSEATVAQKTAGPPTRRLVQVLVTDPDPMMFHAEIVRRNGEAVGYVRAASYGHTLGGAVGLVMIEADESITQAHLDDASWAVDIAGTTYPARASLRPLYDPKMERVRS
ncbi:MAG: FAD-dependent oxidoreductase, partial [Acidimicrobiia bacterium]|nr:FAD-dependent oxidoreductase [Acidimicrobiia bacterium]